MTVENSFEVSFQSPIFLKTSQDWQSKEEVWEEGSGSGKKGREESKIGRQSRNFVGAKISIVFRCSKKRFGISFLPLVIISSGAYFNLFTLVPFKDWKCQILKLLKANIEIGKFLHFFQYMAA